MKNFESMTVISVECYCKVNLPSLNVWKWITLENINSKFRKVIKSNQLYYFK